MVAGFWDIEMQERWFAGRRAARLGWIKLKEKQMAKGSGIKKEMKASEELRAIVKEKKLSRGAAIKGFWKYVKRHDLQSSSDGRIVKVDDKLRNLFPPKLIKKDRVIEVRGKELKIKAGRVFMTEVASALSAHLS